MARQFLYTPTEPVADTAAGKLHGFQLDGIYSFRGIREAANYGCICPVESEPAPSGEIYIPHGFWPSNEHCQYLNVWTTSLDRQAKKPVMVWFHGGGFANGSSIEQVAYEGDELARSGDVVVVTVNHRLNILGFLDMSSFGEKYANSANAGIADLVEALRWVRDNIAGFGGDSGNVTVFGQSGGGGKVQTLMQTPAAAGLFHRAILMSGIMEPGNRDSQADHRELVLAMLRELNIPEHEVEKLETVPYTALAAACRRASLPMLRQGKFVSWGPRPNDWYLEDPMEVGFTDIAKTVPTMAGTVVAELGAMGAIPFAAQMPEDRKRALLEEKFGARTDEVTALYKAAYPDKDVTGLLTLDVMTRLATTRFIEEKARVSDAPAYLYNFALDFDLNGGRPAWHCGDIPFVLHNTWRVPCANMEGVTERLEAEVSSAWVNFARTGDPNGGPVPRWPAYSESGRYTMVFDRRSAARDNYDRELMETLHPITPSPFAFVQKMMAKAAEEGRGGDWLY